MAKSGELAKLGGSAKARKARGGVARSTAILKEFGATGGSTQSGLSRAAIVRRNKATSARRATARANASARRGRAAKAKKGC